jgi:hypothetical protein
MEIDKKNIKTELMIAIIFLILGFLLCFLILSPSNINKDKTSIKEIDVLNKEINNCIDKLNECTTELDSLKSDNPTFNTIDDNSLN